MSLPRRRLLLAQACLLFAAVGVVCWLWNGDDGLASNELLSQRRAGGDGNLKELESEREEALEKVQRDEGKYVPRKHSNNDEVDSLDITSPTSQLASVKSPRCGSLCRARREIVKVKANLDSTANSVIRRLSCGSGKCSSRNNVAVVRRVPVHEFIQPIIQPLQPVVAQAVVQPVKRELA
jgi:hypothetical protein